MQQALLTLVLLLQVVSALAMIGLVLVQHGKGADMGASFGSGASGSLFGATGSANFLSRSTAVAATVFFVATLALAYFGTNRVAVAEQPSLLEQAASAAAQASGAAPASAPATPASGAALIPGK
ncbi:MAG: preprotein translocase subunit SecG [Burkholderiales bacterium RIFCSPHIGHO2_01_FULL_63_240]|jgi:preprotein translocase subunit SecG|nr:MAG: preprotein translocase subunit SecG [Burkholderiales bacterium RIFCSPHIGHO2_01_FULL_63_240]